MVVAAMTPGRKQYDLLLMLASGTAGLSMRKRRVEPMLAHGWVTAEWKPPFYQWVRITAEGLRALAVAVERYGLPDLGPKPVTTVRVCGDCGSGRYRLIAVDADEAARRIGTGLIGRVRGHAKEPS